MHDREASKVPVEAWARARRAVAGRRCRRTATGQIAFAGAAGLVLAGLAVGPASLAAGPASLAAGAAARFSPPARPAPAARPVVIASGTSAYPEATTVLSASSGGYVVEGVGRNGAGQLTDPPTYYAAAWSQQSMTPLPLPGPGLRIAAPSDVSIAGSMISALETTGTHDVQATVFTYDLASGSSATASLPVTETWQGAAPDGYLVTTTARAGTATPKTVLLDVPQSGASPVTLGTLTGVDPSFVAGPLDVVATEWDSSSQVDATVEFVSYRTPGAWRVLADSPGPWDCTSITGASVGCFHVTASQEVVVDNYSLAGGALIEQVVSGPTSQFRVLVTPETTSWSACGQSGCSLTRLPDSSTSTTTMAVPNGWLAAGDGEIAWGTPASAPASSGVLGVPESSTSPTQLAAAPLSPLGAAAISVANGSVTWVDNALWGLALWRRAIAEPTGQPLVLGTATQIGAVGFEPPAEAASPVAVADGGAVIAYTTDNPAGWAWPVGISAFDAATGSTVVVTHAADGAGGSSVGSPVSVSGAWVAWSREGTCELTNVSTGRSFRPRLLGAVTCTAGSGRVAWVTSDGAVKVIGLGPKGLAKQAVQLLAPVTGTQVRPGSRVYLGGAEVAWDFSSAGSSGASLAIGYRDYRSLTPAVSLPSGREIEGLTGRYLAITNANGVNPTVRDLLTGAIIHLAPYGTSLSVGGNVAAWIGADGLPRIEQLPS